MLGQKQHSYIRQATGSYVNGVWTAGAETSTNFYGTIQPLNSREIDRLPEGTRASGRRKLYTKTNLRTSDIPGVASDLVVYEGKRWEVHTDSDHQSEAGSLYHHKYILWLVTEDET